MEGNVDEEFFSHIRDRAIEQATHDRETLWHGAQFAELYFEILKLRDAIRIGEAECEMLRQIVVDSANEIASLREQLNSVHDVHGHEYDDYGIPVDGCEPSL